MISTTLSYGIVQNTVCRVYNGFCPLWQKIFGNDISEYLVFWWFRPHILTKIFQITIQYHTTLLYIGKPPFVQTNFSLYNPAKILPFVLVDEIWPISINRNCWYFYGHIEFTHFFSSEAPKKIWSRVFPFLTLTPKTLKLREILTWRWSE